MLPTKDTYGKSIVLDGVHENKSIYKGKEGLTKKFLEHNEWIKQTVPKEKLLVVELGEGCEPRCQFLDKLIVDVEYPHVNTTADMLEKIGMKADKEVQEATISRE